ncbi:MAG: tyrosine-type recombinase/integrase [Phycisphaerales bacterium]
MFVFKPSRRRGGRRIVSRLYSGRYRLAGDVTPVTVPLHVTDKRVAEEKLRQLVRQAELERAGVGPSKAMSDAGGLPLAEHLKAYLADLDARAATRDHRRKVRERVSRLLDDCGWRFVRDVTPESFTRWRSAQSLSPKTLNEYLGAMRAMLGWLHRQGRIAGDPLACVGRANAKGRATFERRALTVEECQRLLAQAGSRRLLYLTALRTGLRKGELRALTWADVELNGDSPSLRVRAAISKNRKQARLPLTPELAAALLVARPAGVGPGCRVFSTTPTHRTIRADFEAAGIERLDDTGRKADFHALRHTFATELMRAGVPVRAAMELMRHSDIRLTANVYTDAGRLPVVESVRSLPSLLTDDSPIDSLGDAPAALPSGPCQAQTDKAASTGGSAENAENKALRRARTRTVASGPEHQKNGAGGYRTPVP